MANHSRVTDKFWLAVWLSLARVRLNVKPSLLPVFTMAVPAAIDPVQVRPSVLDSEIVLVVVPVWYVAVTESVLDRLFVVQVTPAVSREFRLSGANEIVFSDSPATCTEQVPKLGAPMMLSVAVGCACIAGTVAVNVTEPPLAFVIDPAAIV